MVVKWINYNALSCEVANYSVWEVYMTATITCVSKTTFMPTCWYITYSFFSPPRNGWSRAGYCMMKGSGDRIRVMTTCFGHQQCVIMAILCSAGCWGLFERAVSLRLSNPRPAWDGTSAPSLHLLLKLGVWCLDKIGRLWGSKRCLLFLMFNQYLYAMTNSNLGTNEYLEGRNNLQIFTLQLSGTSSKWGRRTPLWKGGPP